MIPIPEHPRIHHLGFVDDQDKFDAMAASELLIMPSYLESLSMVALEAWALGKPVLANAEVRRAAGPVPAQQRRPVLRELPRSSPRRCAPSTRTPSLQAALGRNGRAFFERHYSVAGDREEVHRHAASSCRRRAGDANDGADARLVRAAAAIAAAGRRRGASNCRPGRIATTDREPSALGRSPQESAAAPQPTGRSRIPPRRRGSQQRGRQPARLAARPRGTPAAATASAQPRPAVGAAGRSRARRGDRDDAPPRSAATAATATAGAARRGVGRERRQAARGEADAAQAAQR